MDLYLHEKQSSCSIFHSGGFAWHCVSSRFTSCEVSRLSSSVAHSCLSDSPTTPQLHQRIATRRNHWLNAQSKRKKEAATRPERWSVVSSNRAGWFQHRQPKSLPFLLGHFCCYRLLFKSVIVYVYFGSWHFFSSFYITRSLSFQSAEGGTRSSLQFGDQPIKIVYSQNLSFFNTFQTLSLPFCLTHTLAQTHTASEKQPHLAEDQAGELSGLDRDV